MGSGPFPNVRRCKRINIPVVFQWVLCLDKRAGVKAGLAQPEPSWVVSHEL